ncbi:MAG: UDP-N-acetylglucosamine 1-carboxyvinyltransferase [Candidatus Wildermuthbacteria bacterium]|nr:UDP-N-acetylglucosamine 1-carboxyvinyltransferase [Candidatus Wildermuthbacteria bacterium]
MGEYFRIQGRKKLEGDLPVRGSKNAAFPLLAASLLTKEACVIGNLPHIEDVSRMLEILTSMGVEVDRIDERSVRIRSNNATIDTINKDVVLKFRGAALLFGPLLSRFRNVSLPQPGGCIIGARPLDTHVDAFRQLGARVRETARRIDLEIDSIPKKREVILNEFSVTATLNVMLFAASCPGTTVIKIADQDYQVQELARVLRHMGAAVTLGPANTIVVEGVKKLSGFNAELLYDPIEAGTFIVLAASSRGRVVVRNVEKDFLELFLKKLKHSGVRFAETPSSARLSSSSHALVDIALEPYTSLRIEKIQSWIYPGIHSDLQSVLGVLATQAKGSTLLHDPLYEGRLKYLEELNKMGAEIYIADPHRAIINGPTLLHGTNLGPLDLRGGAALIIAALIAKGESTINNVYQVDRGYEAIEKRLQAIGADIIRTK